MDTLQAGFQTAPVKLPLTPYQKAVNAREAIAQIIRQQMTEISRGKVCSYPAQHHMQDAGAQGSVPLPGGICDAARISFEAQHSVLSVSGISIRGSLPLRECSAHARDTWCEIAACRCSAACMQGASRCCLASMMAEGRLTEAQIIDNVIAAAFGNASAGPTAAKAFQHLAAGDTLLPPGHRTAWADLHV